MRKKLFNYFFKRPILSFFLFLVFCYFVYLIIFCGAQYTGYCWQEHRFLSTQEKFNLALHETYKRVFPIDVYVQNKTGSQAIQRTIFAPPLSEFLATNEKDCCRITQGGSQDRLMTVTWHEKMWDELYEYVVVRYRTKEVEENGVIVPPQTFSEVVRLNSCGIAPDKIE
jgi:hypothetical protein